MTDEQDIENIDWNHIAYENVLDCLEPQYSNVEYIERYRYWITLQRYPYDNLNDEEY